MDRTEALPIIARLGRTKNFPRDEDGLNFLADGLIRAAGATGANPEQIVMICATTSEWCPTDADLMTIAGQIRDEQKRAKEALEPSVESLWKKKYGEPQAFDWKALDIPRKQRTKNREREMYSAIKKAHPEELTWAGMIAAARELGYDDYADTWERGMR